MIWQSLVRALSRGWARGRRAEMELARAYRDVFAVRGPTGAKVQMVLADMANASGFFRANGMGFSADDRAWSDGARSHYARVHRFLRMTEEEMNALAEAARLEAIADSEGQI